MLPQVCLEVVASAPTDEHTLNTVVIAMKSAGMLPEIKRLYEAASAKDPTSLTLLKGLFTCTVR